MMATGTFTSYDGAALAYHRIGHGEPLVIVPGGPARPAAYLGDMGGLSARRELIPFDQRGVGDSPPADPSRYRLDRVVDDVEALRAHLGLSTIDLLGHSAGANVAVIYAARHPERVRRLVLLTGGQRVLGIAPIGIKEAVEARSKESWYAAARAAEAELAKLPADVDPARVAALRAGAMDPFLYGRWDDAAQAHAIAHPQAPAAAAGFYSGVEVDTAQLRSDLAGLAAPVLVVAGELDFAPTPSTASAIAEVFPNGRVAVVPGGGHFPWLDCPDAFTAMIADFLSP
jgi:pimeloyl-ACP methyl ester carboxylesterase